jgi:O-antigen ligase
LKRFLQHITHTEFVVFWCCVLIQALIWSKALLSISIGAIFIISLVRPATINAETSLPIYMWIIEYLQIWRWRFMPPPQYLSRFLEKKDFISVSIFFLLMLIGGLWTTDVGYWVHSLRIYLPFLLFPLAFANMPPLSIRQFQNVLYFFFICMVLGCVVVLSNFLLHNAEIITLMRQGRPMPLMREHINFGRMTAFAVLSGLYLSQKGYFFKYAFEKKLIPILSLFLFVALHILSIRSALVGLYLCIVYQGLVYIFKHRQYIVGVSLLCLLGLIPVLSYNFIPSFKYKLHYALWDYGKFKEGAGADYSDAERLQSITLGWNIFKNNWKTGVGSGDIWHDMQAQYATLDQLDNAKLPHNQLLVVGIKLGIIGIVLFLLAYFYPLFHRKNYKNELLVAFYLIGFSYFWFEIPFEASFGASFYAFWMCLFFNNSYRHNRNADDADCTDLHGFLYP